MRFLFFSYFISVFLFQLTAQKVQVLDAKLPWESSQIMTYKGTAYEFPMLKEEVVDPVSGMPVFILNEQLARNIEIVSVDVSVLDSVKLSPVSANPVRQCDSISVFNTSWNVVSELKIKSLSVRVAPIYTSLKGEVFVAKRISLKITTRELISSSLKSVSINFALESVLSKGRWVKIRVDKTGIYQIDYATLAKWGFNDVAKVRIYGNGGSMLPKSNSTFRYDDLAQNAVYDNGRALLFYAKGNVDWNYNSSQSMFIHKLNDYDSGSYYFLTEGDDTRKVFQDVPSEDTFNATTSNYVAYDYHEINSVNLVKSGKEWLGEQLSASSGQLQKSLTFPTSDIDKNRTGGLKLKFDLVARSGENSNFQIFVNNNANPDLSIQCYKILVTDNVNNYADARIGYLTTSSYSDVTNVVIKYIPTKNTTSTASGWINSVTINTLDNLIFHQNQLLFRNPQVVDFGNTTQFKIAGVGTKDIAVLDVSNPISPLRIASVTSLDTLRFNVKTEDLKEFIAFDLGATFATPEFVQEVGNQNLHSQTPVDYVIVSPTEFLSEAKNLAQIHSQYNEIDPLVVTTEQIYNEFSSGKQDPLAIRDFMRMLYARAGNDSVLMPKYLLLYGDGSYDNLGVVAANKSKIVTCQSDNSLHQTNSYVTDDVFGFLDDNEGLDDVSDKLDIGIGRFAINDLNQAKVANSKVLAYLTKQDKSDWQTKVTFLAQDGDNNLHQGDAEDLSVNIRSDNPEFILNKIYADAYPKVTTSQFGNFPEADRAIQDALVTNGTLIFNYTGHGAVTLIAYNFLNAGKVDNLNNIRRLPLFVTATCDVGRFDNPEESSLGEHIFLNPIGGGIGLLSTTRVVYSYFNKNINLNFYKNIFRKDVNNEPLRLGEVIRRTKNATISSVNKLNFALLCDPGLRLNYPRNIAKVSSVENLRLSSEKDTLHGLTLGMISGEIQDKNKALLSTYNGTATITLYDKISKLKTFGNSGQIPFEFAMYENVLYKGKVAVSNGKFSTKFIVPQDIKYEYGKGKITVYSTSSDSITSFGVNENVVIGDLDKDAGYNTEGPQLDLFMNSYSFKDGGETGATPLFIGVIADENSINTTGSGIGHDLMLEIDGNSMMSYSLNSFFEFDANSYTKGTVKFQLPTLTEGKHTVSLRAWDSNNNSSRKLLNFNVKLNGKLSVDNISLYPNPVNETKTLKIYFTHDEPNTTLNVKMEVYGLDGVVVNKKEFLRIDYNGDTPLIEWVPETLSGMPLCEGIYICKLWITTSSGQVANFSKRFVIVR